MTSYRLQTLAAPAPARPRSRSESLPLTPKHYLVLSTLALVITIRVLTEELHVLPRAFNFIDVPLCLLIIFAAVLYPARVPRPVHESPVFVLSVLFLGITTVSALVNLGRVDIFPALTFVYDFLGPAAFFMATYVLWQPGRARSVSRLFVGLMLVQFVDILVFDIPQFLRSRNPDAISGTFGTNQYQLVFFLLLFIALVAGIATFEPESRIRLVALPLIGASFLMIFLAQYRTLLITTALTSVFIGALIARRQRGLFFASATLAGLLGALLFVLSYVPTNKFTEAFSALQHDRNYFIDSRLGPADDVYHLYGDYWAFPLIGAGPGTYSSRAWATFAVTDSTSASDVASPYARELTGGRPYTTDVSRKYVEPRLSEAAKYGTHQFSDPYSSYLAVPAEVGLGALGVLLALYGSSFVRLTRAASRLARESELGDPLPALALTAATAFFVLLQAAVFQNWFEVSRVTVPTWILFAIVVRELDSRAESAA